MSTRILAVLLGLLLASQGLADSRGSFGYRIYDERDAQRSYQYDPRSPYPQHRMPYRGAQPPRYQQWQRRPDQRLHHWHEQRHLHRDRHGYRHAPHRDPRYLERAPQRGFNGYGIQPRRYQDYPYRR